MICAAGERSRDYPEDPLTADLHRELLEDPLAGPRRWASAGPSSSASAIPAATASGSWEAIRTPASSTTSGIAVTFITTGTQPASIASATARPKPSWREACT